MKPVRAWRISAALPFGVQCWFDPEREMVMIRDLTPGEKGVSIATLSSVSALIGSDQLELDQPDIAPEELRNGS